MPDSQSIGKLISIIHRKSQVYFRQRLEPLGLTHGQVKIFEYLRNNDGATQQEITGSFQLDKSSTSYLINKMVDNGYVRKKINPDDRRSQKLYLTDIAIKKQKEVLPIFLGWTDLLLDGFSPDEKEKAFELINRMINNIDFLDVEN